MANFTSAAIGSTGQSLDGLNVSTSGGPALFLEAVAIGDPTDGGAIAPVSSTLGLSVNVASTVAQSVNVSVVANQITSSIPFWVSQSSSPWGVTGTVSTQVVSSIPFYVAQSSAPWTVNGGVAVTNVPTVNVTNVPQVTVNGTSFVSVSSSQPIIVAQSTNPWTVGGTVSSQVVSSIPFFVAQSSSPWTFNGGMAVTNSPNVNVTNVPAVTVNSTSFVSISSSQPIIVAQSSSPWGVNGQVNVSSFTAVASVAAIPVTQGGLSAFLKIGVTTASVTIKASAGKLHDIWFTNTATSTRWLKFYNASAAAIGTTAPLLTFGCPGTTTGANAIAGWIASAMGIQFSTAIFVGCTASSATSTDTSAPAAGDIILNCGFI